MDPTADPNEPVKNNVREAEEANIAPEGGSWRHNICGWNSAWDSVMSRYSYV